MPLYTTKYALPYPVPSDKADPPRDMKVLAERIESVFGEAFPIGTILPFGGATLPARWAWCDGTAHSSDALLAVTGSNLKPNLGGKFPVGAGTKYALNATGGAASVSLVVAQVEPGGHAHAVTVTVSNTSHTHDWPGAHLLSGYVNQDHGHVADPGNTGSYGGGGHEHGVVVREGKDPSEGNEGDQVDTHPTPQATDKQIGYTNGGGGHEHVLEIGAFWTSGINVNHAHQFDTPSYTSSGPTEEPRGSGSVGNSTAVAPSGSHENRPPYTVMRFIIKTGVIA
jgi:microcystin-dependent protein